MHYTLEVIMPPTDKVEQQLAAIMAPFCESDPGCEKEDRNGHPFWDWYVIGGRFSGEKLRQMVPEEKLEKFHEWCQTEGVTVSGFQAGKPTLQPASQILRVDMMWREIAGVDTDCILFDHYKGSRLDICTVAELPAGYTVSRVIVAAPGYDGKISAQHMLCDSIWNGVCHQDTDWNGSVADAIARFAKDVERYRADYRVGREVKPDWLSVLVDYHS